MEGAAAQVVAGQSENSHIFYNGDGFYYHLREVRRSRARLKCRNYFRGCKGTACINLQSGLLYPLSVHNHVPDPLLPQDLQVRRDMIAEARRDVLGRKTRRILHDFKIRCRNPDLAMRFTTARMHSSLYSARSANYPRIPKTLIHLGILLGVPNMTAVCRTVDGTDVIFKGIVGIQEHKTVSLVFVSGRMLQFLQSRRSLHGDGTFKKRPRKPKSNQIYNIVTRYGTTVICVVRALMMSRTEAAYLALFNYIKVLAPNLQPSRIHCDFEQAQINAWRQVFPQHCAIVGCLWHYGVACSSQARILGLASLANENHLIFTFIKCLCGAPLLPKHLIWEGVLEIWGEVEASGWDDMLGPLFHYFQRTWPRRLNELSVFGFPERTNNCSESDNRMLANSLPQNHPNIWHFIGALVRMEHLSWSDKLAVEEGRSVTGPRRWKAVANDARIQRLSALLDSGEITPGQFLHKASWAILAAVNHGLRVNEESDGVSDDATDSE